MGRLSGFSYRQITKRRKAFGFEFDRRSGTTSRPTIIQPSPTTQVTCLKAHCGLYYDKPVLSRATF